MPGGKDWLGISEPQLAEGWEHDESIQQQLRNPLTQLAAYYLCQEKGKSINAVNPVAHFHLSNGAQVQQINWMADPSSKGLKQSAGLMVNYYYELGKIEERSQAYRNSGKVSVSSKVKKLINSRH